MTNPDNVGGLLPCPGCGKSDLDHCPADFVAVNGLTRGMIVRCAWCHFAAPEAAWNRRELCRAAPAVSGEVEDWMVELFDEVYEREWNRAADEADDRHKAIIGPADRHATREAIAAILRKLQQGADYSFRLLEVGEVMLSSDEYVNDYGQWVKMAPPFIGMAYMLSMRTVRRRAASQGQPKRTTGISAAVDRGDLDTLRVDDASQDQEGGHARD